MEKEKELYIPWPGWRVVDDLGSGAFGKVFEIERNLAGVNEKAAMKIISRPTPQELEWDFDNGYDRKSITDKYTNLMQRCISEYKVMIEMKGQSNIVSCDDFAVERHNDGIGWDIYIRMELLTPLTKVIRKKKLTESEVIKLGKDICQALILCESRNIIHRDIKPANIMLSKFGDFKLGDFGQAKILDHTAVGTQTGTPNFWAPEVKNFEKYGKEADIYSLGMVMYVLLNNRKMPFIDAEKIPTYEETITAGIRRYQGEKIPEPKYGSMELKKVVLKACEYKAEDRYHNAREMYQALENLGNTQKVVIDDVIKSHINDWDEDTFLANEQQEILLTERNGAGRIVAEVQRNTVKKKSNKCVIFIVIIATIAILGIAGGLYVKDKNLLTVNKFLDNRGIVTNKITADKTVDNEDSTANKIIDNEDSTANKTIDNEDGVADKAVDNEDVTSDKAVDNEDSTADKIIDNKDSVTDKIVDNENIADSKNSDNDENNGDAEITDNSAIFLDTSKNLTGIHHVEIEIKDYGTMEVELDADTAPITVTNFVKLVQQNFYDGLTFHRVMDGFMIQGGDPNGDGTGGSDETIKGEFSNNGVKNEISHTRGTISMARASDPDSGSSQFFIVQYDSTFLDGDYAGFGHVTSGMEVVDKICEEIEPINGNGDVIADEQPVIETIRVMD